MMPEETYHDKFAKIYDAFTTKPPEGDIDFYLERFKNFKGKILELGAGTGRITIPLLKSGVNVTALDLSANMLELLAEKAEAANTPLTIVHADMQDFELKEKYDAIIITYRAFQLLYSVASQLKTLANCRRHLKQNGELIFDVFNPDPKYIVAGNWRWHFEKYITLPKIQNKIKVEARERYDRAEQTIYKQWRIHIPGKVQKIFLKIRFFFRFEIEHLLARAGFKVIHLYGDFAKSKFESNSKQMVWIARPVK